MLDPLSVIIIPMIAHPVIVCNPRGIYSDHVAHHILMFMLALSRGLPYWIDAQRAHRWGLSARKRGMWISLVQPCSSMG